MVKSLPLVFEKIYNSKPEVLSSAPGRINLIGEHTDYNQGYVLPAAIHLRNYFLLSRRKDKTVSLWTENLKEKDEFSSEKISFSEKSKWVNYVRGVFWVLKNEGYEVSGINGVIQGDVPLDAGLSSSAALEVSIVQGLNSLFELGIESLEMVRIARRAENDFVGVKCGIMDQFISVYGQKSKAIFLDCETLGYEFVPLRMKKAGLRIIVYESGVRRELATSEYNLRRIESSCALEFLKKRGIQGFKKASLSLLEEKKSGMEEVLFRRARHVISENERVRRSVEALGKDNFRLLGELIFASHQSLKDDYEVSCPELDLLVEVARKFSGCFGARLTGAGFGGAGIALVKKERMAEFRKKLLEEADNRGFIKPEFYAVDIGEGVKASVLDREGNR